MAISVIEINKQAAKIILSCREGHFIDVKSKEIAPNKLSRHLSAFANADGGEMFIGIDEDKQHNEMKWNGFLRQEDANGHIQCFESLFPLGQEYRYEFFTCKGLTGYILHIEISKSQDIKTASDAKIYLRRGAQSLPVDDRDQRERLKLNKGITSFENYTIKCDLDVITNSYKMNEFMSSVVPTGEPLAWLKKQQIIKEDNVCVSGVLLFSDEPQALLPKRSGIKIYRYKTNAEVGTRDSLAFFPITIEGCLYDQIYASVAKVKEIIEQIKIIGANGLEDAKYPVEALHEIITNAVIHRDYSIKDDIHIRIFDNRIEIENPGKLPAHITPQNILEERFSRNGTIVRLINKFPNPPNKDVGEGLNTAFESMQKMKLKDPIIQVKENSVIVYLKHEPLASPEELVMDYLNSNETITNSIARKICHIGSENVVKRVFERLINRGLIERIPELKGKSTAYRIKK